MKIGVRVVNEVREGKVHSRSVRHNQAYWRRRNPVFIRVEPVELGFGSDQIEWNGMGLVAICSIYGFFFFGCNLG